MSTSIVINSTSTTGKKYQKTVTDINPAATSQKLIDFGQNLNALTTNTYNETNRVDKTNCDNGETGLLGKKFRNIAVTGATKGGTATITFDIDEDETTSPAVFCYSGSGVTLASATAVGNDVATVAKYTAAIPAGATHVYVGIIEKDAFYSELVLVPTE